MIPKNRLLLLGALMFSLVLLGSTERFSLAATTVFINEIHYDNEGTDVGEAIEIAGPAGTDLTGWSLVLYNGSNGQVYDTTTFNEIIPNQQNNYGTVVVNYATNGIQNGAPDGMALVDNNDTVIQFLSYEGEFTAVGGPADGMMSVDIGVEQTSSTPVGASLQLTGSGTMYEDFTWIETDTNTFGAPNTGQTFAGGGGGPAAPVINEFVFNHIGSDTHEFVEIFGDPDTDYAAYTLLGIEGDSNAPTGTIDNVFPLGSTDANGFWTTGFLNSELENGTLTLLLVENFSGSAGDDIDLDDDGVIDNVLWSAIVDDVAVTDGGAGDLAYSSVVLGPGFDGNSFTPGGASRIPNGTDTDSVDDWVRNDFDGEGLPGFSGTPDPGIALNTPGAANAVVPPAAPTDLVINEIDYDQPGTDTAEFIEIKNNGGSPVNLNGVYLELVNGSGGGASVYNTINLPDEALAGGDYFVVCSNVNTVANCDLEVSPATNLIQNGAPDAVALLFDGQILDTVSYEGDTGAPYTEGSGVGLEDDPGIDNAGISRFPDGVDTDQNNVDFSLRCITPGLPNTADNSDCPTPQIGGLVINEIDYDQPGTDDAEFIEIKNASNGPINLDGYVIELVNGSGGGASVYNTITLPDVTLNSGDYYVVCGNLATVPNCDLEVSPATNLIQNGAPDAVALLFDGAIVDTVSYEGDTAAPYTEGSGVGLEDDPDAGYASISRFPDGVDTDQNNIDFSLRCATPGAANTAENSDCQPPVVEACGADFTPIYAIQGSGASTPLAGTIVSSEGVVTADFLGADQLDGFFMQDPIGDGDPATSDGIFVYAPGASVTVGDVVRVRGEATEFFGLTQIANVSSLLSCGAGATVAPTAVTLPVASLDDWEPLEGMLITFPGQLTATDTFNVARFGEIIVSNGRLPIPTEIVAPGAPANAQQDLNDRNQILVDDGSNVQNPPVTPYLAPDNTLRLGDAVTNLTGVLGYGFNSYRLQPTESVTFTRENPREGLEALGGDVTVASFNVLNYWTTLNNGSNNARGANSAAEFARQEAKLVAAILGMNADIVGLQELENNGSVAIDALVDALNAETAPGTWAAVPDPASGFGDNAIRVAIIYQPANVTPVGSAYTDTDPIHDRPPLAQTFEAYGNTFTVITTHFKSKGCSDATGLDTDQGDGQGCYNATRVGQSQALLAFMADMQAISGDPDVLLIGDFNSYTQEDPLTTLSVAGLVNETAVLPQADRYSFVFFGQAGLLDHVFSTGSMSSQVTGVDVWHINADEPRALDYNDDVLDPGEGSGNLNPAYLYNPDQYRSSDHDPLIVHLSFNYFFNEAGCYVLALDGSPFTGSATTVYPNRQANVFNAFVFGRLNGLPRDACFEIHGTDGDDRLFGGNGDDFFFGYDGSDWLHGQNGNDTFTGGPGVDFFLGGPGIDTVTDYEPGVDFCNQIENGC